MHYFTSIANAMNGSEDDHKLVVDDDDADEDEDDDYEGASELEEIQNERLRSWLDSLSPATSPLDSMVANKGNI